MDREIKAMMDVEVGMEINPEVAAVIKHGRPKGSGSADTIGL